METLEKMQPTKRGIPYGDYMAKRMYAMENDTDRTARLAKHCDERARDHPYACLRNGGYCDALWNISEDFRQSVPYIRKNVNQIPDPDMLGFLDFRVQVIDYYYGLMEDTFKAR